MTILQLISSGGYYGAENMLVTLASALQRKGHPSTIVVFEDGRHPHLEVADSARRSGLTVEVMPCKGRWDSNAIRHIRRLMKLHGASVLHTHGYKADIYGYVAAWPSRIVLVSTCHNWPDRQPLMQAYAALDRLVLRHFDRVAAASEPVTAVLKRWRVAAAALPNGVELDRFRHAEPVLRNEMPPGYDRLVGFVGRMVNSKGGAQLLESARAVLATLPRTAFVFVGEGPCRPEWEALAARLGIARDVYFTGTRKDMPEVYASLDVLALPSLDEALPMCLLEAMASGRPVIATRVGSVPRAVLPGVTGLLLEPGDSNGLAEAMLSLLSDAEFAARLGGQAREHVVQYFSAETMAAAYLGLYEQALAQILRQREWGFGRS